MEYFVLLKKIYNLLITQNTQSYFNFLLYLETTIFFNNIKYSMIFEFYTIP